MHDDANDTDTKELGLNLSDWAILQLVRQPIRDAISYWDGAGSMNLAEVRRQNMNLWLPNHWDGVEVYDWQEDNPYLDNRIFTSVETIASTVNARIPQVDVMPANETPISRQVSQDVMKYCWGYTKRYNVLDLFRLSGRNLQIKRGAFIKLRFDPSKGKYGEIVSEFVQPEDIIVDKDAAMGEIPRFITHIIRKHTAAEIIAMLPGCEQKIYKMLGITRKDKKGDLVAYKTQLGKKLEIYETWFRYLDTDGAEPVMQSGVMWTDPECKYLLDKDRNPNWNYEEDEDKLANLFDEPMPPFIPINYLNDGSSYIDQTSLIEQAKSLQKILNKRGFQIMENADQAGGGLVFNTKMITKDEIGRLVGHPDERIGVNGDVNEAVTRVAPPPLPNYVILDKQDARSEIDNVFATHAISRGEESGNDTLGQDTLQKSGDMTRMDDVTRAIERQATMYYRYLVQMIKVYYTEEHWIAAKGDDGQPIFVALHGDMLENGIDIEVVAGSMRPIDTVTEQKWIAKFMERDYIDPLTVFEVAAGKHMPSPEVMLERFLQWKTNPMGFGQFAKSEQFSREAYMDIQVLNGGEMPKIRDEYSPDYLNFVNNYMLGGDFEKQPNVVKQMYYEHVSTVQAVMARHLQRLESQMPTQEEFDVQGQKAAEQATLQSALQAASPQQPGQGQPNPQGAAGGAQQNALAARMTASKGQPITA